MSLTNVVLERATASQSQSLERAMQQQQQDCRSSSRCQRETNLRSAPREQRVDEWSTFTLARATTSINAARRRGGSCNLRVSHATHPQKSPRGQSWGGGHGMGGCAKSHSPDLASRLAPMSDVQKRERSGWSAEGSLLLYAELVGLPLLHNTHWHSR